MRITTKIVMSMVGSLLIAYLGYSDEDFGWLFTITMVIGLNAVIWNGWPSSTFYDGVDDYSDDY